MSYLISFVFSRSRCEEHETSEHNKMKNPCPGRIQTLMVRYPAYKSTASKLTCHNMSRRHICFNIKSIHVHPLLWMNVMLGFICLVFAELLSTGYNRKIQNDNVCPRRESNHRPLAFQRVPLTTRLAGLLKTCE